MSENISEQKDLIIAAVLDLNRKLETVECIQEEVKELTGKIALEVFADLIESIYLLLWESVVVNLSWLYEKTSYVDRSGKQIRDKKSEVCVGI